MRTWRSACLGLAITACGAEGEGEGAHAGPEPLVEATSWAIASEDEDSFAEHRPPQIECDPLRGTAVEANGFEINTAWCNYVTLTQPIAVGLEPGDEVEVRVWHFELTGAPAQAYLGVALAGEPRWERSVPIPSGSELIKGVFTVEEFHAPGSPLQFHLNNHGSNSWLIVSIERL